MKAFCSSAESFEMGLYGENDYRQAIRLAKEATQVARQAEQGAKLEKSRRTVQGLLRGLATGVDGLEHLATNDGLRGQINAARQRIHEAEEAAYQASCWGKIQTVWQNDFPAAKAVVEELETTLREAAVRGRKTKTARPQKTGSEARQEQDRIVARVAGGSGVVAAPVDSPTVEPELPSDPPAVPVVTAKISDSQKISYTDKGGQPHTVTAKKMAEAMMSGNGGRPKGASATARGGGSKSKKRAMRQGISEEEAEPYSDLATAACSKRAGKNRSTMEPEPISDRELAAAGA